jgi:hypothetical protein
VFGTNPSHAQLGRKDAALLNDGSHREGVVASPRVWPAGAHMRVRHPLRGRSQLPTHTNLFQPGTITEPNGILIDGCSLRELTARASFVLYPADTTRMCPV